MAGYIDAFKHRSYKVARLGLHIVGQESEIRGTGSTGRGNRKCGLGVFNGGCLHFEGSLVKTVTVTLDCLILCTCGGNSQHDNCREIDTDFFHKHEKIS